MRRDFDLELQAARDERSDAIEREIAERERRAAAAARLLAPVPAPPVYPQPTPAVGYDEEYLDDLGMSPLARPRDSLPGSFLLTLRCDLPLEMLPAVT